MNARDQARMEDSWAAARFNEWSAREEAADDRREAIDAATGDIFGSAELGEALCEAINDANGDDMQALLTALRAGHYLQVGATLTRMVEDRVTAWAEQRVDLADDDDEPIRED